MKEIILTKTNGVVKADKDINFIMSTLRNGRYILTIKRFVEQRTLSQNNLFWLWMECLSRELGGEPMEYYRTLETKYLSRPSAIDHRFIVTERIKHLDTQQMSVLMDKVKAEFATECGIYLPLPQDRYYKEFIEHYGK